MITVVSGAPLSGKSTYVRENAEAADIVIDFDVLARALGSPADHDHPPCIVNVATQVWLAGIREVTKKRQPVDVWIVDTEPTEYRRSLYTRAGAKLVALRADPGELEKRANERK